MEPSEPDATAGACSLERLVRRPWNSESGKEPVDECLQNVPLLGRLVVLVEADLEERIRTGQARIGADDSGRQSSNRQDSPTGSERKETTARNEVGHLHGEREHLTALATKVGWSRKLSPNELQAQRRRLATQERGIARRKT